MPAGPDMVYTMTQRDGTTATGLYQLTEEMKSQGIPPNWLSYVSVANVDETAAKAKSLGATIAKEPFDVMEVGRMAVIEDPTGAVFALWQAKSPQEMIVNEPGGFCWNELYTTNIDKAGKFYTELFNWSSETADMGGMQYTSFKNGDRPAGGMMAITKEMGEVPPHWLAYLAVEDTDAAVEKIKTLGGNVVVPPTDIPDVGRFAVALDPQGAVFSVIKLTNPE
jgi:predicted enzyme related to lactoylglutathione lyase